MCKNCTAVYDVNPTTGLTGLVTDPKQNKTKYTYNTQNNLLTDVKALRNAGDVVNSYGYDTADRINQITHNGFDYTFQRDGYGNTTIINVGTQNLITHIFGSGNGNLLSSNYGNGFKLSYFYDDYDRVTSVIKNGATAYIYGYDSRGNLAKVTDKTNGSNLVTNLSYDVGDRLIKKSASDGSEIKYCYDTMDRPTSLTYNFAGESKSTTFGYKEDNRKGTTILPTNGTVTREYDSLNREFKTDVNDVKAQEPTLRTLKTYLNVSGNRTTNLIDKYNNIHHNGATDILLSTYKYTYDDNGNISTITDEDNKETKYTYDGLNQLVRVDDQKNNISTAYSYDVGGNITQVKTYDYTTGTLGTQREAVNYSYGNANWKDLLTDYNGQSITYDAIGNPLSYRNDMSFTWEGRQLKTAVANGKNLSYTYNNDGIRTSKTADGVTTEYFIDGSTILAQKTGNDVMWFLYDSDGTKIGFTYNGQNYYYLKNAQGDITGIVDKNCNTVVEYTYDAWGKLLNMTDSSGDAQIGQKNPFLYRGYYYDSETGLYYLNSRYYDPQTGRFLNADFLLNTSSDLTSKNLFSYCGNNPVSRIDPDGEFLKEIGDFIGNTWNNFMNFRRSNMEKAEKQAIQNDIELTNNFLDPFIRKRYDVDWEQTFNCIHNARILANQYAGAICEGITVNGWIERSAYAKVGSKFGKKGQKAFSKALKKGLVGDKGQNGIKRLTGSGVTIGQTTYRYELKVFGEYSDWRIYGNIKDGVFYFDKFDKALHK